MQLNTSYWTSTSRPGCFTDLIKMNSNSVSELQQFLNGSLNFCVTTFFFTANGSISWLIRQDLMAFGHVRVGFSILPTSTTVFEWCTFCLVSANERSARIYFTVMSDMGRAVLCLMTRLEIMLVTTATTGTFTTNTKVCSPWGGSWTTHSFFKVELSGSSTYQHLYCNSEFDGLSLLP